MDLPCTVLIAEDALAPWECEYFVEAYRCSEFKLRHDKDNPFWSNRILDAQVTTPTICGQMEFVAGRVGRAIETHFGVAPLYTDSLHLVRWGEGQGMPVHLDAVPEMPWREFGSVVYLNDDFTGGQTFLEEFGIEIQPKTGMLIAFPGDWKHRHGVRPVHKGERFTMPNFWTSDESESWKKKSA
jgi:hypothetical protein